MDEYATGAVYPVTEDELADQLAKITMDLCSEDCDYFTHIEEARTYIEVLMDHPIILRHLLHLAEVTRLG